MTRHNLFNAIISFENLLDAWREFKKRKAHKKDVLAFEFNLEDNVFDLHTALKNKTYVHGAYESFCVCDPKLRHIHKASVRDRLLHQAVYRQLYIIFNPQFIYDSYSCRLEKGVHAGVSRLELFTRRASNNYTQKLWYLQCDVSKFFDSIDHHILKEILSRQIRDQNTMQLCIQIIDSFSKSPGKGLPLGNVTSQLFANVYMNEFDQFMKHTVKTRYYLRYCDDFVILDSDRGRLYDILNQATVFLHDHLKLSIHPDKVICKKVSCGIDFLGYVTRPHCRTVRTKTKHRMYRKLARNATQERLHSYIAITRHAHAHTIRRKLQDIHRNYPSFDASS